MSEKTLGQIAYEAAWSPYRWDDATKHAQLKWEQGAQAVAAAVREECAQIVESHYKWDAQHVADFLLRGIEG